MGLEVYGPSEITSMLAAIQSFSMHPLAARNPLAAIHERPDECEDE